MRRFHFEGDDAQYIVFLEDIVQKFGLLQPTRLPTPPSTIRGDPQVHKANNFQQSPPLSEDEGTATQEQLRIVQYEPSKVKKNFQVRCRKERWQKELDHLVLQFPSINALNSMAEKIGLGDNRKFISSLVDGFAPYKNFVNTTNIPLFALSDSDILNALRKYALFTKKSSNEERLFSYLAKFRGLIFVSFCDVALNIGQSKDSVHEAMRLYISASEEKNLDKIISGSRWVNRCIVSLYGTNWGLGSPEIFILGGQSMNFYGRYSEYSSRSSSYFLKRLNQRAINLSGFEKIRIPISIPCIIKLFGFADTFRLAVICRILGYEHNTTHDLFQKYYNGKFTECSIGASPSNHRHERDSCENIRGPRKRARTDSRDNDSEINQEKSPNCQSVFSSQQHPEQTCNDFQTVEILPQMDTCGNQQRNGLSSIQLDMPISHPSTEAYSNNTDGTCHPNTSEGTRTFRDIANTQIDSLFSSQSASANSVSHINPCDMNGDSSCYLGSDWLDFGIEGDWSSLYNTGYNTGSITGLDEPSGMDFI